MIEIGDLNRRGKLCDWVSEQDGFELREEYRVIKRLWCKLEPVKPLVFWLGKQNLETGATHRVTVRSYKGVTDHVSLSGRKAFFIEGHHYKIINAFDLEGLGRFTVAECSLEEVNYGQ